MGVMIILTILFLAFLTAIFLAWYFVQKSRERERHILIEKGVDISKLPETGAFQINFRFPWLKIGVIIVSASVGILTGLVLSGLGWTSSEIIPVLLFLFAGIGMIIAHYIDGPNES